MSGAETFRLDIDRTDGVATIAIDRPPLNVLDLDAWRSLASVVDRVAADPDVRVLLLHGGVRAFATGAEVRELLDWGPDEASVAADVMHAAVDAIAALPIVTIAVVSGYVLGGGLEIALACDVRLAADNAKMGFPEVLLGAMPGAGGTQRLPRLIGPARAKALILSGRMVDMVEAPTLGLVDEVHPVDAVLAAGRAAARRFAAGPASLMLAKRAIDEGFRLPLAEGLALERRLFAETFTTEDVRIGARSFLEHGPGVARFEGH